MKFPGFFSRLTTPALVVLSIALTAGGIWLLERGYSSIKAVWQLERIRVAPVSGLLPGEVLAEGLVKPVPAINAASLLTSKLSQQQGVYFRYLHEKQIGSDDNERWSTQEDIRRAVDFQLQGSADSVIVSVKADIDKVNWSIPVTTTRIAGNHRYREWVLRPGDEVTILGWYQSRRGVAEINFSQNYQNQPFISGFGVEHEIQSRSHGGIAMLWGGLVLLGFAVFALCYVLRIHRILAYLTLLSLTCIVSLTALGLHIANQDLHEVQSRVVQQLHDAEQEISFLAAQHGLDWQGLNSRSAFSALQQLPDKDRRRLNMIKLGLERSVHRAQWQLERFPENFLSIIWDVRVPAPAALDLALGEPANYQESIKVDAVPLWQWIVFAISVGLAVFLTISGMRAIREKRWIENIPVSKVSGVVWGINELRGRIANYQGGIFEAPLSKQPCVWFDYRVFERKEVNDKKTWKLVEQRSEGGDFLLTDGTGSVLVNAQGADISTQHRVRERRGEFRMTESSLREGDDVYLLGTAELAGQDEALLRLSHGQDDSPYIISDLSEHQLLLARARKGMLLLHLACSALMLAGLLLGRLTGNFTGLDFLLTAALASGYLLLLMLIMHYNDLVFLQHRVQRSLANIDVALQKRFDLTGNLLSVVQRYAAHERELLEQLTGFRRQHLTQSSDQSLDKRLQQLVLQAQYLLPKVAAVAEDYPELKQQQLIKTFMDGLTRLEDEVSLMRDGYNDALEIYLTRLQSIPDILIAKMFRFNKVEFRRLD